MVAALPNHKVQYTGDATLDRIQGNVGDVYSYLGSLSWVPNYAYVELAADVTISSTSLVDLLTAKITTTLGSSFLLVTFSTSFAKSSTAGTVVFTISVDGTDVRGAATTVGASADGSLTISVRLPVKAGAHTVKARWLNNAGAVTVAAHTAPLNDFASLLIEERP